MRLAAAFAAHEIRTQWRSLRFRVLAVLYVLAGAGPAALLYARHQSLKTVVGSATYASEMLAVLPTLTAVVALLISLDAVTREHDEGSWSTASLAGMSSAGYLLRRWLALQAVLLPLTAVPVVAAGAFAAAALGPGAVILGSFLIPWLMLVVPLALALSALGLGLGTIAGGMVNACLLGGVILWLVPSLLAAALARFGLRLVSPIAWPQTGSFLNAIQRIVELNRTGSSWANAFPLPVSESPWDARVAGEQYLALAALPAALAVATLGIAVRHLRRTRPNVRPLRVRAEHPLRTFLLAVARLRERYTPDPRPSRADLLALALTLLLAAGAVALPVERTERYQRLGVAQFEAERDGLPDPTPVDLVPGRWQIRGTLGPGRRVNLEVTGEMRNLGRAPQSHLAFSLNPFVEVTAAETGGGRLSLSRRWDRVAVDLANPIPPGGARELRFRLRGEPAATRFPLNFTYVGFHYLFGQHLHARFDRDLVPLGASYQVPALSPRRIDLAAADLTPVPRYRSWKLVPDEEYKADERVPPEVFSPAAEVSLDLTAPPGVFVADSCGGQGVAGRLASRCRLPLAELAVAGGRYQLLPRTAGGATVGVFPLHAPLGDLHLGFLSRGTARLDEAWPGLGDLTRTVVLEWPDNAAFGLDAAFASLFYYDDPSRARISVQGELVRMRETDLIRESALKPDTLVAELVAGRLVRRRPVAPDDTLLYRMLLRNLVLQRLGLGPDSGAAVVGVKPGMAAILQVKPPAYSYSMNYWNNRFPALLTALRYRMGEEALRGAVDDVLGRTGAGPATRDELYAAIEKRSEAPVDRLIEDYFVQGYLPEPFLDGVDFRHSEAGWRVTGRLGNRSQGESICKVVLTTDLGRLETTVRTEGKEAVDFAFATPRRPQAVLLDPDRECHRLIPSAGARDRVFFDGRSQ
ncbi:MAG TPA: hypothetical protein VF173_10960 [Thermoanaerobaculia bacterium]|nr:hypothetical protein [Thermoanaerobaculia bacterium]